MIATVSAIRTSAASCCAAWRPRARPARRAKRERHRRGRRERNKEFRKTPQRCAGRGRAARLADAAPARERARGQSAPPRERFQGKGGDTDKGRDRTGKFGGRDKGGRERRPRPKRPDSGPSHRQYATSAARASASAPIDPNSPFAKLAALKEQLTADRKD